MIKHIWSILCRRSIVDNETNNISINDVFEQLSVDLKVKKSDADKVKLINIPIEFEVVCMWVKNDKTPFKGNLNVEILNPKGTVVKNFEQPLEMPETMKRLRSRLKIMGMVVEEPGDYIFRVNVKEEGQKLYKAVAELPLEINLKKEFVDNLEPPKT
ncbi:hypothetical protein HY407_04060 [Candidatus Gottesmanbacteria bacterium]|nr:hypothetical protein [Candidatus Gottesmanbacteria bacterium]